MRKPLFEVSALLLLACAPARAEGLMKPGLWEIKMKSEMTRAIADSPDGSTSTRLCITREMAERKALPGIGAKSCQKADERLSGGSYSARIVCASSAAACFSRPAICRSRMCCGWTARDSAALVRTGCSAWTRRETFWCSHL